MDYDALGFPMKDLPFAFRNPDSSWTLTDGWPEENDSVDTPEHYRKYPAETIKLIETLLNTYSDSLTPFQIYCWGTEIAYRMRAGFKEDAVEDIAKAMKYYQFREESEDD